MPNTISSTLVDRMYAIALKALRRKTSVLRYCTVVNDQFQPSQKFGSVVVPIPAPYGDATDITPNQTPPAGNDTTPDFKEISLTNWKSTNFHFTDYEMSRLQDGVMGMQMEEAIDALSRTIVKSVLENYRGIYQFVGTAGTVPFATDTTAAATARKVLNRNGVPMMDRALILNFDAEQNAIGLPLFQRVNESGDNSVMREGYIGRRLGFDWDSDAYMPTFTGGTLSNGTTKAALVNGAVTAGATAMNIDSATLTGTLVVGDLFTVAGGTEQYVVTAAATASGNAINGVQFSPAATRNFADNAAITFVANHEIAGLAMQKQAIAFASRPLVTEVDFSGGNIIKEIPDPHSGLVVNMEISREYKRTKVEFSCLWGSTLVRPQSAVRILG